MKLKILSLAFFILFLVLGCEKAPVDQSIDQKIERVAKKYMIHGRTPGIIVGTIKNGETNIYSYGVANLETGASIDEYTIFEIGSITKTFTALLSAQFVLEGKFALQDTVNNHLKPGFQLPSKNGVPIRWVHLLNHTSGLDREPDDLNFDQPFDYSESEMSAYLSRASLLTVPGEEILYSNTGMGLAGYTLTEMTDSTYASLLENRIFTKLNMSHSFVQNSDKPATNTAQGYMGDVPEDYFEMTEVFAGAGVIKSNMHDMLIYLDNCLHPETSVLKDAIDLTLSPTFQIDAKMNIGLGWFTGINDENQNVAFHDGGTYGFASFIILNPDNKSGVVVLVNSYCFGEPTFIGTEIIKLLDDEI